MLPERTSQYDRCASPGCTRTAPAFAVTRSTWSTPKSPSTGVSANSCDLCRSAATSPSEIDSTLTTCSVLHRDSVSGVISHPWPTSPLYSIEAAIHLPIEIDRPSSHPYPTPSREASEPRQVLVHKLHRDRSFAHRRSHAFHRSVPHVSSYKHPGDA